MDRVFSTYRYVNQPLSTLTLSAIRDAGISKIELFCSGPHFDYSSTEAIRDLSAWLEERNIELHSLHSPTQRDTAGRHESGMPISISDGERVRRLDAVDEVKRAIDVAERIPFKYLVQHMGSSRQSADPQIHRRRFQFAGASSHLRQATRRNHRSGKYAQRNRRPANAPKFRKRNAPERSAFLLRHRPRKYRRRNPRRVRSDARTSGNHAHPRQQRRRRRALTPLRRQNRLGRHAPTFRRRPARASNSSGIERASHAIRRPRKSPRNIRPHRKRTRIQAPNAIVAVVARPLLAVSDSHQIA